MIGCLFDNDGVLVDTSALHWLSWQLLMEEEPQFHMSSDEFIEGFGKRNELILKSVVPEMEKRHLELAARKEELFRKCARGAVTLLPGMEDFLKKLQKSGMPRIIASSTPIKNLEMYIESTVLGIYFDQFVSGEEVAEGKPAPDVFLEAARRIKVPAQQCIVFEDAPVGVTAGKSAGCFVVALGTTHPQNSLKAADLFYPSARELNLDEIIERFQKVNN